MGEPRSSLKKFDVPLEEATSASPEALQFLAKAFRQHFSSDQSGTIALYERAIDIDPNFALAYASVGIPYMMRGNLPKAIQNETKAFELRNRLTGQLKYLAETLYYNIGLGDLVTPLPIYQEWVRTFPLDGVAHTNYSGELYQLGRYDEAAAEAREGIRLMPQLGLGGYASLMYSTVYAGRLEEAKLIAAEAMAKQRDDWGIHGMLHLIAFLQHDDAIMHAEEEWLDAHTRPGYAAYVSAYYGRFGDSRRRTEEIEKQVGSTSVIADALYDRLALDEAEVGDLASVERILKVRFPPRQPQAALSDLALALARTGHAQEGESMAAAFDHLAPHGTLMQFYTLPTIRASIKLSQNDPAGAVRLLEPARDYELTDASGFNSVYPAYIRGLAYLKLGQGDAAAHEFQKLIDHPAIVGRDVIGALAHLQMGRAQAMSGNRDAARGSYQDFLKIWKDADPDIPIYKQAKAEYASLL
jgi:tetratricopeptide (TPR) repeat protein